MSDKLVSGAFGRRALVLPAACLPDWGCSRARAAHLPLWSA